MATIEYPVKTMNIREHDQYYQIDTGPVAWPDLSRRRGRLVDLLSLAFVTFNARHFADFVIEVPTTVGERCLFRGLSLLQASLIAGS